MEKPKILFVNQEIYPYVRESQMSKMGRYLPQGIQECGKEIRTFMPKFGTINERRNQLHEVIRLSGMNLIINDSDHPLIIKVASIQAARMQIYFIDNEEYFHKKNMFHDKNGKFYEDNDEKAVFFARGVIETIKKLSWTPDIIHCNGWFTSLVPLYIKKIFKDSPIFANTKIITSLFSDSFEGKFNKTFVDKLKFDNFSSKDIQPYGEFAFQDLMQAAVDHSDGLVLTAKSGSMTPSILKMVKASHKPVLSYPGDETYVEGINKFYEKFLSNDK